MRTIETSRRGVSISKLVSIQDRSPFSEKQWAEILDMTPRTLQRQKQKSEVLDTARSERVILIDQLLHYGEEVFGERAAFAQWLLSASLPLEGKQPVQLLDTATGIQMVHAALGRIDHGVYV